MLQRVVVTLVALLGMANLLIGCVLVSPPAADRQPALPSPAVPPPRSPEDALIGTWVHETPEQRTTLRFSAIGSVHRTLDTTTMLGDEPVTGRQDFLGTYRWLDAAHLEMDLEGTVYNSVEGTRRMEMREQWEVTVDGDSLSLKHRESPEAGVFRRVTPS